MCAGLYLIILYKMGIEEETKKRRKLCYSELVPFMPSITAQSVTTHELL